MCRMSLWMTCLLALESVVSASQAASTPVRTQAFEVASVRENATSDTRTSASPGLMTPFGKPTPRPGRVMIHNMALRDLITLAYEINPNLVAQLVTGGPARILDRRFDIEARPPEGAAASETLPMIRTLLAERFKLKVHTERREVPIYALVVARQGQLGRALRPSDIDCNVPGARKAAAATTTTSASGANARPVCMLNVYEFGKPGPGDITLSDRTPLTSLIARIQPFMDRPLVDATGLVGSFEWSVSFATNPNSTTAPSIYSALPEQLGIRAERRTAPFDVVVIDSVEMPTPN